MALQTSVLVTALLCTFVDPDFEVSYIRFSTKRFSEIGYGTSPKLVPSILSTVLINEIGKNLQDQLIVRCDKVAK